MQLSCIFYTFVTEYYQRKINNQYARITNRIKNTEN